MQTFEVKLMAQKEGREPACLWIVDIEAPSPKMALDIAYNNLVHTYLNAPLINHDKPLPKLWTELA